MNDHDALLRDIELERADAGTIADRASLADQLRREHYEGMAEERVLRDMRQPTSFDQFQFEGWTINDELIVHIAGMGTLHVPASDCVRIANALLSEYEMRYD